MNVKPFVFLLLCLLSLAVCQEETTGDAEESAPAEEQEEPILEIHLRGASKVKINQLEAKKWSDPGIFVSQDGEGVDAELFWKIPKEINKGEVGWYFIKYSATSTDGREAKQAERIVIVTDIDECELGPLEIQPFCSVHATCVNTNGTFECHCNDGFSGDGFKCVNIDECAEGTHECDEHATCIDTPGSYRCECHDGFQGDGKTCEDIDECETGAHDCSQYATCENLIGSYDCHCNEGFEGDGRSCTPVNKCEKGTHDCHENADCAILPGGAYLCTCKDGFRGDGKEACDDIDECAEGTAVCPTHSHCVNTVGSYDCECDQGFELLGKTCVDIDECEREIHNCSNTAYCINEVGSYNCICKEGYTGDGYTCRSIDPELDIILRGNDPLVMQQCDEFNDPGIDLVGREGKKDDVDISISIPAALGTEYPSKIGEHEVAYHASVGNIKKTSTRAVVIQGRNLSELPIDHPCRPSCPPNADLIFIDFDEYDCICDPEYGEPVKDEDGNTIGCRDNRPPIIELKGKADHILLKCKVCSISTDPEEFIEERDGGFSAYDESKHGRIDLTDRVEVERTNLSYTAYQLTYSVTDDDGNNASVVRTVRIEVEDIHERIVQMEDFLQANFDEFRAEQSWILTFLFNAVWWCFVVVVLILLYYVIPKFINFIAAVTQKRPSFPQYRSGYDFWYSITRPWLAEKDRARLIHAEYTRRFHDKLN